MFWIDYALEGDPDDPGWYDVERFYRFDWEAFSEADWARIAEIWKQLPDYRIGTDDSIPRWFSEVDDPQHGYLWASVELGGLQVAGTLRAADLENWHQQFIKLAVGLPVREW